MRSIAARLLPFGIVFAGALAGPAFAAPPAGTPPYAKLPVHAGCTDNSRVCLEAVARTYVDALLSHDGSKIPLAPDVRRTENALTNAKGPHEVVESFVRTDMIESIKDVRFYTDLAKGEVVGFFVLNIDLKHGKGADDVTAKAGNAEYKVAVTVPAGTYTVHEVERFKIVAGKIHEIEIVAHVESPKDLGSGWPIERDSVAKK